MTQKSFQKIEFTSGLVGAGYVVTEQVTEVIHTTALRTYVVDADGNPLPENVPVEYHVTDESPAPPSWSV